MNLCRTNAAGRDAASSAVSFVIKDRCVRHCQLGVSVNKNRAAGEVIAAYHLVVYKSSGSRGSPLQLVNVHLGSKHGRQSAAGRAGVVIFKLCAFYIQNSLFAFDTYRAAGASGRSIAVSQVKDAIILERRTFQFNHATRVNVNGPTSHCNRI